MDEPSRSFFAGPRNSAKEMTRLEASHATDCDQLVRGREGLRVSTLRNNLRIERTSWDKRNPGSLFRIAG